MEHLSYLVGTVLPVLSGTGVRLGHYFKRGTGSLLLLLIGLVCSRAVSTLVELVLSKARLDERASKVGVHEVLARIGMGKSPTFLIAFISSWSVLLAFLVATVQVLKFEALNAVLADAAAFLPRLVAAVLLLFAGVAIARLLSSMVERSAIANNVRGGTAVSWAAYVLTMGLASIWALEELGLTPLQVQTGVYILLASLGLAFGLSFGLGGRDIASQALESLKRRLTAEKTDPWRAVPETAEKPWDGATVGRPIIAKQTDPPELFRS